jgi:hypothetical protein
MSTSSVRIQPFLTPIKAILFLATKEKSFSVSRWALALMSCYPALKLPPKSCTDANNINVSLPQVR